MTGGGKGESGSKGNPEIDSEHVRARERGPQREGGGKECEWEGEREWEREEKRGRGG